MNFCNFRLEKNELTTIKVETSLIFKLIRPRELFHFHKVFTNFKLSRLIFLSLRNEPVKLPVLFHSDDPYTERLGRHRHHAHFLRLEFRVRRVLADLSKCPIRDVVLVEVSQLKIHAHGQREISRGNFVGNREQRRVPSPWIAPFHLPCSGSSRRRVDASTPPKSAPRLSGSSPPPLPSRLSAADA